MTVSDYRKAFKQLQHKPAKLKKYLKHNKPKERKFGPTTKRCRRCGSNKGHIGKYGINLCRKCFREIAHKLGFK
ncbi:30S ribosomal protein S14, partial [Candidatus Woesearchaeota archaeon]|nr:30S ribosomal protein S14 [Candidatus Woesearchaeota archaeon]